MTCKEEIDYESLGKWIRRVRERHKMTQEQAAREFHVSRTVLSRYESGTVRPRWEDVERFAERYHENLEEIRKKVSIVIPDTCALRKNKRLLHILLEDYDKVVIPTTVTRELSRQKNRDALRSGRRLAWQILANIDYYVTEYAERFEKIDSEIYREQVEQIYQDKNPKTINDYIVIELAKKLSKKTIGDVVIITDDIDLTTHYEKAVKLDDYVARRTKTIDYEEILELDNTYKNISLFQKKIQRLDIDAYLPDGMTLLISCIRCRTKEKVRQLGNQPSEKEKYEKMRFLIENGADIDKLDNVQKYAKQSFKIGFVGNGESFLDWPLLKSYIQYLEDWTNIHIYTITNGTIKLSEKDLGFLEEHRVNVGFSLDGYRELHNKNRCDSFEQVMENVEYYRKVTGHYPTFNATVGRESLRNAEKVIAFFKPFGTKVTFSRMIGRYGISLEEYRDFLDKAEKELWVRRGEKD